MFILSLNILRGLEQVLCCGKLLMKLDLTYKVPDTVLGGGGHGDRLSTRAGPHCGGKFRSTCRGGFSFVEHLQHVL